MKFLVDTNILIYSLKNVGNVSQNFQKYQNHEFMISVITYGELIFGAEKSQNKQKNLQNVMEIAKIFPMVNINPKIMQCFGELKARLQSQGKTIDDMDLLIGATAIVEDAILVTHNTKHFCNIPNLQLTDWFVE